MFFVKKHISRGLYLALIWLLISWSAYSQDNIKFDHYGLAQGLSQVTIQDIAQDSLGYIWLATQDGLNRFNGYDFKVFKDNSETQPTISSIQVFSLINNSKNQICIGLSGGLLNIYNFKSHHFKEIKLRTSANLQVLSEFNSDTLLVGAANRLYTVNTSSYEVSHLLTLDGAINEILTIDNRIWAGTNRGLFEINPYKEELKKWIYNKNITSIEIYNSNFLLGTDDNGLMYFNLLSEELTPFHSNLSSQFVLDIHLDRNNIIWIGTEGDGLFTINPENNALSHFAHDINDPLSISNNRVRVIYEDKHGIIWIGTDSNGFCKYDPYAHRFKTILKNPQKYNINSNRSWAIYEDDQQMIWVGTDEGLNLYDRQSDKNRLFKFSSSNHQMNSVRTLHTAAGMLWLGTENGIIRFNPSSYQFDHYEIGTGSNLENRVRSILSTENNKLLIATLGGLFQWDIATNTFSKSEQITAEVWTIKPSDTGNIWVGTGNGLYLIDNQLQIIKTINTKNGLSNNSVHQFIEEDGVLWITTYGGGINKYDFKQETFTVINENSGLPTNACSCVLKSNDNLWISTINGFARYDLSTQTTTTYHTSEGLQGVGFNVRSCFKSKSGELFFGGTSGVNHFKPNEFFENPNVGLISIENIFINNHALSKKGVQINNIAQLELPYDSNNVQIEFAALNYSIPSKNRYSYKLDGFDDWSNAGTEQTALYRKLPPGEYEFLVKSANHDDVWSAPQRLFTMTISPPWWNTLWAKVSYIAFTLLIAFSYVKYRTRHIKKQKKVLEHRVKERTARLKQVNEEIKTQNDYIAQQNSALRANEEKLRQAHLIAKMGGWEYDVINDKPHWYREVLSVFDLPFDKTPTSDEYLSIIHPDDRELFMTKQKGLITKQEPYEAVIRHRSKSGKYLHMRIVAKPLVENGKVTKILGTAMNITDRIESESKFERVNKTKDMILATVAHDLRSPINAIRGMINLLRIDDTLTPSEQKEIIRMMEDSADKGLQLIAELLEYSEIQNDSFKIKLEKLNVSNYIEEAVDYMMQNYHDSRISLHLDAKDISAKIDKKQLSRVIENLLNNARKFTPEDGKIDISTYEKGAYLVIKIADTGIGIPDELKPVIFERFSDARRAGLKGEKSTGLGMSIVKRIVDLHEGKIHFESEVDVGTTFFIEIPIVRKSSKAKFQTTK